MHSCGAIRPHGETELRQPESGFYIIGNKSYGRAPTFLLATGYEQARSVTAALVGDWEAAKEVHLELPESGVCSGAFGETVAVNGGACCQPEPLVQLANLPLKKATLAGAERVSGQCC